MPQPTQKPAAPPGMGRGRAQWDRQPPEGLWAFAPRPGRSRGRSPMGNAPPAGSAAGLGRGRAGHPLWPRASTDEAGCTWLLTRPLWGQHLTPVPEFRDHVLAVLGASTPGIIPTHLGHQAHSSQACVEVRRVGNTKDPRDADYPDSPWFRSQEARTAA